MLDLFETIFIWCLYLVLPTVLIIRFLGRDKAGLLFSGLLFLSQTDDMSSNIFPTETDPSEILVNSTSINSDLNEIVLVKNPSMSNRKNKKKFNLSFHRQLEKHFPDWDERMSYQKKQEKFYKSARMKQAELRRVRMIDQHCCDILSKGYGEYAKSFQTLL
jgi:hypothetical protein